MAGEDTTESSSQQKNQKGNMKKAQKKKFDAYASSGAAGSRSDYRDHRDYRDSRQDYSNINHIYGLNQNSKLGNNPRISGAGGTNHGSFTKQKFSAGGNPGGPVHRGDAGVA